MRYGYTLSICDCAKVNKSLHIRTSSLLKALEVISALRCKSCRTCYNKS